MREIAFSEVLGINTSYDIRCENRDFSAIQLMPA